MPKGRHVDGDPQEGLRTEAWWNPICGRRIPGGTPFVAAGDLVEPHCCPRRPGGNQFMTAGNQVRVPIAKHPPCKYAFGKLSIRAKYAFGKLSIRAKCLAFRMRTWHGCLAFRDDSWWNRTSSPNRWWTLIFYPQSPDGTPFLHQNPGGTSCSSPRSFVEPLSTPKPPVP